MAFLINPITESGQYLKKALPTISFLVIGPHCLESLEYGRLSPTAKYSPSERVTDRPWVKAPGSVR